MADWQEWITTCCISFIFAYMVAKLVWVVISFRRENLRVDFGHRPTPAVDEPSTSEEPKNPNDISGLSDLWSPIHALLSHSSEEGHTDRAASLAQAAMSPAETAAFVEKVEDTMAAEQGLAPAEDRAAVRSDDERSKDSTNEEDLLSDNEDWEGIADSELRKTFRAATSFFEKLVLDPPFKISNDLKLQFYGLYKQATEGPCSSPQPSAYRPTDRAKWHAWKKLGDISPEEGMQRYIALLTDICADWNTNSRDKALDENKEKAFGSSKKALRMGPVFSMPAEETSQQEGFVLEDIHICAKEGDIKGLEKLLENTPVDQLDSEGRTALHWAVDQGHLEIVKLLVSRGAQINAKDSEGQTALHYATTCQWEEISEFLLRNGADPSLTDNEGCTPYGEPQIAPKEHSGVTDDAE